MLDGRLRRQDCDDERVHKLLKLLKVPPEQRNNRIKNMLVDDWERVVKGSKKRSASSIFSKRTHAAHKCALGVERMTHTLVDFCNVLIKNGCYPSRWLKTLDAMLGKGKGWIIGKLRIVTLIEADSQFMMRIQLGGDAKELIEEDNRFSKANYGSRRNYSIESAILEKRLAIDNSLLSGQSMTHHMTDLKACYDRQLVEVGGIPEESVGRDRAAIKLITKVIPNWNHYVSVACGISEKSYGGKDNKLAGTGQGNRFQVMSAEMHHV